MYSSITSAEIRAVAGLVAKVASIKFHRSKKDTFLSMVAELSPEATWLLAFCCWFQLFNSRFKPIDASKYYCVPAGERNQTAFTDFIQLVLHYEQKRITRKREGPLCTFLTRCDAEHKDFYLSVMSRGFIPGLPLTEVQMTLDLDQFSVDALYTPYEPLTTGLADLTYPVAIRTIPSTSAPLVALAKEPTGNYLFNVQDRKIKATKIPSALSRDISFSVTPRFTVVGFYHDGMLYPIDTFDSLSQYRRYLKGVEDGLRLESLSTFCNDNLLTSIDTGKVMKVPCVGSWGHSLKQAMGDSVHSTLLVFDEGAGRGLYAHHVDVRLAHGVLHDLWVEDGNPLGFKVWFNGSIRDCSYDFSGRENALLSNISPAKRKRIQFFYIQLGRAGKYLIGKDIQWNVSTWRQRNLQGTDIWIEKCVFCGKTEYVHRFRGMCKSCYHSLFYHFTNLEKNTWVKPTPVKVRERKAMCWEPELLNCVNFQHQGHVLRANTKGEWGFFEDEEAMTKYIERIQHNGTT